MLQLSLNTLAHIYFLKILETGLPVAKYLIESNIIIRGKSWKREEGNLYSLLST